MNFRYSLLLIVLLLLAHVAATRSYALSTPATGAVAATLNHVVSLKSDGTVWAWGGNANGQLGDGTTTQRTTPVQVSGLSGVVAVAAGAAHSVALKSDGTVWAWGGNANGQLGDGTTTQRTTPVQVSGLSGVVVVSAGSSHSVALKSDGTVWAWGGNANGQLGDGTTTQRTTPVQVSGLSGVVAVAAGAAHSMALKGDGTVWAWGANSSGQLGDGTTTQRTTAVQVSGMSSVAAVVAGSSHSVAMKSDGTVWAWGDNYNGRLGDGTTLQRKTAVQVSGLTGVVTVAAGPSHNLAVKSDGTVWAWGYNANGQLGDGTTTQRTTAVQVTGLSGALAVAVGGAHSVFLKSDGTVWTCGSNGLGQLGDGTPAKRATAVQVGGLRGVVSTVVGGWHNLAVKSDGMVWAWGANANGQLGDGTTTQRTTPVQVSGLSGVVAMAASSSHSVALKSDGAVWAWGANTNGQLGDGTKTGRTTPVQVSGLSGVVVVVGGPSHSVAVKGDGTVWAWGANANGQLGDGTTTLRTTPVQVSGLTGVVAVAAGPSHSVAVKSDGTVWAWGYNANGQLGDGTTTQRTTAVQVSGLTGVVAVAAGGTNYCVALKSDGTVWTWGSNGYGQLGDGTTTNRKTAVQVSGLGEVVAVDAGFSHNIVVKSDGTVWAWGANTNGELGDGTTTQRTTPVQMSALSGVVAVAAGDVHSVVLCGDGTIRAVGSNNNGQLGFQSDKLTQSAIRLIGGAADTDQDGMLDWWEEQHFGDIAHSGGADGDADGLTDIQEFTKGSDPTQADPDGDLFTDFADPLPTDYYNQEMPTMVILDGDNQEASPGEFNAQPFDMAVFDAAGSAPLVNAPVTFNVTQGGGLLAEATGANAALATTLTLRTDEEGTVQAYYQQPTSFGILSRITATAGNAQVAFQTRTLSDTDGDGLSDSDENQRGTNPLVADSDGDGLSDGTEVLVLLTNPLATDTDGDGMADGWENTHGFDANNPTDGQGDLDGDGLPNSQEFLTGANPAAADNLSAVPVQFQAMYTGDNGGHVAISVNDDTSEEGGRTAYGTASGADNETSTNGCVSLVPGMTYVFDIGLESVREVFVKFTAPEGYRVYIDNIAREMLHWGGSGELLPNGIYSVAVRIDGGDHLALGEATSLRPRGEIFAVGLGNLPNGESAGALVIAEDELSSVAHRLVGLFYNREGTAGVEVIRQNRLRQVCTPAVLVDILEESAYVYYLRFYPRDSGQVGAKENGVYTVSGTPLYEFRIENPTLYERVVLRVTKTVNQNGQMITWTEVRPHDQFPTPHQWTVQDWVEKADGATAVDSPVKHRWTYTDGKRSELMELLQGTAVVRRVLTQREYLNFGTTEGLEIVKVTEGEGDAELVTDYEYYQDPAELGDWRRKKSVISSDGSWAAYDYYDDFQRRGRIRQVRRPYENSPVEDPGVDADSGEVTTYSYDFEDVFGTKRLPTGIETNVDGKTTARSEISYAYEWITDSSADYSPASNASMPLTVATRKDYYSNTGFLTTVTKTYREDADPQYRYFPGLLHSVQRPDGTMSVNAYYRVTFNGQTYTQSKTGDGRAHVTINGTTDSALAGTAYANYPGAQPLAANFRLATGKSTSSTVLRDAFGRMLAIEEAAYVSGGQWVTLQQNWSNYTGSFYLSGMQRRTSSSGSLWPVAVNTWTGGRLSDSTSDTGVVLRYTYDTLGRVETITRDAVSVADVGSLAKQTTTNEYDAAGRVTQQAITGEGSTESLVTSRSYDLLGRITSETLPGSGTTNYVYDTANRSVTITLPTTATRTETRYLDGRLASVTGDAVVPEYYDYEVMSDGLRHTKASIATENDVRKRDAWADWLGRTTKTSTPGFTGQVAFEETMTYYATTGLLQKVARTGYANTYHLYNGMGELIRTGLDVSGGGLALASTDRITDYSTSVELYEGGYWATSRTTVYPFDGGVTAKTTGTTRERLTGLSSTLRGESRSWDAEGNETRSTVTVDVAHALVTTTTSRPGLATSQTSKTLAGFAVSDTGHDGLTFTASFDPLGRAVATTDPRTGGVNTTYYPNTALPKETTDALGKRLSLVEYDAAGRPLVSYDAFSKTTRLAYNSRGQVLYRWGSAVYPTATVYNDYGQQTKLRTYQDKDNAVNWDSATWPATSTTTYSETEWEFDGPSGFLKKKYDAARKFVEYSYNSRGQVYQRFWSRTLTGGARVATTYSYSAKTGELSSVSYNDGTPAVSYTYTRLGQTDTVTDYTGMRDFDYDSMSPWRQTTETLPTFFGSRLLTTTYETATSAAATDTSYTGHTLGTVKGRSNGFRLGNATIPGNDLEITYAASNAGRLAGLVSKRNNGAVSHQYVYGYESNSALLKSLSVVGNSFSIARSHEPKRDLLTNIESRWGSGVRTKFAYAYNDRQERSSVVQSGDAYADYGDAIHQIYEYSARGEVTQAATYLGGDPASQNTPLAARQHQFAYDNIGNRKSSNTSSEGTLQEGYVVNNLNQYSSRENKTLATGGTAEADAKVAAGWGAMVLAQRAGRHWGANLRADNAGKPYYGTFTFYAGRIGAGAEGTDLLSTESRQGFLPPAAQSFTYDADGNLTNDSVWDYLWDAENRLTRMTTTSLAIAGGMPNRVLEFRYDHAGRRVQKTVKDGGTSAVLTERRFIYDGWNVVAELDGASTPAVKRVYTWGLDLVGSLDASGGVGALIQIHDYDFQFNGVSQQKSVFAAYDGNGNVAALLNSSTGAVEASYEYSPFGELLRCNGDYAKANPFRFSTKFTDDEGGLVYYGHRYYSPTLGRFVCRDPIEESGGVNLYAFVANNAPNAWDYAGWGCGGVWNWIKSIFSGRGNGSSESAIEMPAVTVTRDFVRDENGVIDLGDLIIKVPKPKPGVEEVEVEIPDVVDSGGPASLLDSMAFIGGGRAALTPDDWNGRVSGRDGGTVFRAPEYATSTITGRTHLVGTSPGHPGDPVFAAQVKAFALAAPGMLIEPYDWFMTGREILDDPTSLSSYAGILPFIPAVAGKLGKIAHAAESANPMAIRFTQPTVSRNFSSGQTLNETADALRSGTLAATDLPTIRVVDRNGILFSLDNRRLVAFQQAGLSRIPIQRVSLSDPKIMKEFLRKYNPVNGGQSIVVTPNATGRTSAEIVLRAYGKIK